MDGTTEPDESTFRSLTNRAMTEEVTNEFMRLIRNGTLRPGERLPSEPVLAKRMGVGRSTLREAKRTLISLGFLYARGRTGTFVADPSQRSLPIEALDLLLTAQRLEELHQARCILEGGAIRVACELAKDDELDNLDRQLDSWSDLPEPDFWAATVSFHEELIRLCHNQTILYLYESISRAMREQQMPLYSEEHNRDEVVRLHRELVDAVRTRDSSVAGPAMDRHLHESKTHDLERLRDRPPHSHT